MKTVLELKTVSKRFGGIQALKDVDFSVEEGEVHALLGENGAGKSTLIKILTGIHRADTGSLYISGVQTEIRDPLEARRNGIAAIYQEMSLIDSLDIAQNIFLGNEPASGRIGIIRKKELYARAEEILGKFDIVLNPKDRVGDLGLGQKKIVEIVKALSVNAKILLLDEPTTGMSVSESETLFEILENLKTKRVTMIYISHHLEEIFKVCDRASVLRDGEMIGIYDVKTTQMNTLIQAMVGKEVIEERIAPDKNAKKSEEVLLELRKFKVKSMKEPIDLRLHCGEVLGVTGIIGSGKSEIGLGIFGASEKESGELKIRSECVSISNPKDARRNGIGFIPEDRKRQGLFLSLLIDHNLTVTYIEKVLRYGFISKKLKKEKALDTAKALKVVPLDMHLPSKNLSGGNQQKVVLGKWIMGNPNILICDEPTRGIDVGAKREIYKLIRSIADKGAGVILLSSEFKEVKTICDRILVLRKGSIVADRKNEEIEIETLMSLALGGSI
jgi:ABC-type sugar transport system ATPase subunit